MGWAANAVAMSGRVLACRHLAGVDHYWTRRVFEGRIKFLGSTAPRRTRTWTPTEPLPTTRPSPKHEATRVF